MESAVIVGAGFSYVAGLPLTRQLFSGGGKPQSVSKASEQADKEVQAAFQTWANGRHNPNAEEWLAELYKEKDNGLQAMLQGTTWDDAVRFALRRLVNLPNGKNAPYYHGISTYQCHPVHDQFWRKISEELGSKYIISMNYDILPEQALHIIKTKSRTAPDCYYGGFQYIQSVRKMTNVTKNEYELLELGHGFTIYKLHGSLNWAWEAHSPTMKIHDDVRAVFRHRDSVGNPAIIPPIPEKDMPKEFSQIWNEAEGVLKSCSHWLVCGYSLPLYDHALREFFGRILKARDNTVVTVIDPYSDEIQSRWKSLSPGAVTTKALPGIPEAFTYDWC